MFQRSTLVKYNEINAAINITLLLHLFCFILHVDSFVILQACIQFNLSHWLMSDNQQIKEAVTGNLDSTKWRCYILCGLKLCKMFLLNCFRYVTILQCTWCQRWAICWKRKLFDFESFLMEQMICFRLIWLHTASDEESCKLLVKLVVTIIEVYNLVHVFCGCNLVFLLIFTILDLSCQSSLKLSNCCTDIAFFFHFYKGGCPLSWILTSWNC